MRRGQLTALQIYYRINRDWNLQYSCYTSTWSLHSPSGKSVYHVMDETMREVLDLTESD